MNIIGEQYGSEMRGVSYWARAEELQAQLDLLWPVLYALREDTDQAWDHANQMSARLRELSTALDRMEMQRVEYLARAKKEGV